jgi:hypothetical protein
MVFTGFRSLRSLSSELNRYVFLEVTEVDPRRTFTPYQKIAIIEAEDKRIRKNQNKDELLNVLFAKAKEMGADGVVILSQRERTQIMSAGTGGSYVQEYLYAKVMAFVY